MDHNFWQRLKSDTQMNWRNGFKRQKVMNGTCVTKTWLEAQPSTCKRKVSLKQMQIVPIFSPSLFASLICLLFLEIENSTNSIKDKYNFRRAFTFIEH